ncbi:MAG TPA: alpha/beta hydrolase [Candidatus Coprenecus stercoravium]|uniref:Alpha/beta hydrolase n=1 Tax=Candidatus Coprenecus stercoravium TaxID=2840735 RepID=A0A9D2K944_9BACT|nr:alpha/beta hydrolase [Candidatus Coprenecus stercoravium]
MEYFVTCGGIPVHVSESGKGDNTIVLLHGYLETLYIWEEFRTLLPGSSRIVSIDLPGLGLTGTDPEIDTMEFDAAVLLALLDRLGVEKPWIIGHSMGGYVAQRFLRDYPERLSGIININSTPYADDPGRADDRRREIDFILNGKLVQLAQIAVPNMYSKANLRKCDEKITETVEICETHDPSGVAAVVRGLMSRDDNVDILSSPKVPVMFIHGDSDIYLPQPAVERIKADLPGCTHVTVPDTAHCTFIESPEATAALVREFISKGGC